MISQYRLEKSMKNIFGSPLGTRREPAANAHNAAQNNVIISRTRIIYNIIRTRDYYAATCTGGVQERTNFTKKINVVSFYFHQ